MSGNVLLKGYILGPHAQVVAEGVKPVPSARSEPSLELPLITASHEELSAMPIKDLKKVGAWALGRRTIARICSLAIALLTGVPFLAPLP